MRMTKKTIFTLITSFLFLVSCDENPPEVKNDNILGVNILDALPGHWVGQNITPFGVFDWFAFDFRPISASHVHSIYEGGTAQSIINSFFIGEYQGDQHIMARNGGWLGTQYRATYFILDLAEETNDRQYYRLVDAVGGVKRSYMELTFEDNKLDFKAYKDDSGMLDDPVVHMQFSGENRNPAFANEAINQFSYPQMVTEINFGQSFNNLIDNDSALYLEESDDPFPRSAHTYLSSLKVDFNRTSSISNAELFYFISTESIIDNEGKVDLQNLDNKVVRTISIKSNETQYEADYLHPDNYYLTAFADIDGDFIPSVGDLSSESIYIEIPESESVTSSLSIDLNIQ